MTGLIEVVVEVAHVSFALLARKLILCSELIAIVGMVGWNLDRRVGLSLWPKRALGHPRISSTLAGSATIALVLYVAFVRDFAELGTNPSFTRYGVMSLAAMAAVTLGVALWTNAVREGADFAGLAMLWVMAVLGIAAIDAFVHVAGPGLHPIGELFLSKPESVHHGLTAMLTLLCAALGLARLVGPTRRRFDSFDLCLAFALLALVQGFLAYRGVSAIFVLAVPAAVGWKAGWRVGIEGSGGGLRAELHRARKSTEVVLNVRRGASEPT